MPMLAVARLDRDVAHDTIALRPDQVDGSDVSPGLADRDGDATQHARAVPDLEAYGEAVGRAGRGGHQRHPAANRIPNSLGTPDGVMSVTSRPRLTGASTAPPRRHVSRQRSVDM